MHPSTLALGLARNFPGLAKAVLWTSSKVLALTGIHPQKFATHWVVRHMVEEMQYRLPISTRLGNGMRITVHANDYVGNQIIANGYYEPEIVRLVGQILGEGKVFVDVGTHVGQYTLVASRLVGETGTVHGFEPDPLTFQWLESNVTSNALRNVKLNKVALSDSQGTLRFYLSSVTDIGSNSLQKPSNFAGKEVEVACDSLDRYLESSGVSRVDLLKIDVEGGEYAALTGARRLLSGAQRPPIIVEFEEARQLAFGHTCAQLGELIRGFGYSLFRIGDSGFEEYVPKNPDARSFNILAIPTGRQDLHQAIRGLDAAISPAS